MRILLAALLASTSLFAATPEKTAKIEQLFDLLKVNTLQDQIYGQLASQVDRIAQQIATQAGVPVAERASATADVQQKMLAAMKDLTSWERLKPGMVQIYDETYSDAELDQIIAFFKSPIGQAYLTRSVGIVTKSRDMAGTHVKEAGDAVQALAKEWLDQHKPPAPMLTPVPK
jgi:hypothetical protein